MVVVWLCIYLMDCIVWVVEERVCGDLEGKCSDEEVKRIVVS